jgi:ornithine carbamoyltransferase
MRHLLGLKDLSSQEIIKIINLAEKIKKFPTKYFHILEGKTLVMLFQKTSTRTRVSFEAAMTQLGGHAQYLDWQTTNFTLGDLKDEIRCLSRYADVIMARVYKHSDLEEMAKFSDVPIINGLSDLEHPCQILGDLLTMKEKKGNLQNLIVSYVGDGNNVCNSLIIGCSKLKMKIKVATPEGYEPANFALEIGKKSHCLQLFRDPKKAVENADFIYTDTWVSMGQEKEREKRLKIFPPYQVNKELMEKAPKAFFMHCLPAHRGQEVTDEVLESPRSIVFDQAENRLHIQKAILLILLKK